jgi:hypothetical protein
VHRGASEDRSVERRLRRHSDADAEQLPEANVSVTRTLLVVAVVTASHSLACSMSANSADYGSAIHQSRPPWYTVSVQESTRFMEPRCTEHAPLSVLYTTDPVFVECEHDSEMAAVSAIEAVSEAALADCILAGKREPFAGCCFAKETEYTTNAEQRCDQECARRVGRSYVRPARATTCHPDFVSPARSPKSRAYTSEVAAVVHACAARGDLSEDDVAKCDRLSTPIERSYCHTSCVAIHERLNVAVLGCATAAALPNAATTCDLVGSEWKEVCDTRCQEERKQGLHADHLSSPSDPDHLDPNASAGAKPLRVEP